MNSSFTSAIKVTNMKKFFDNSEKIETIIKRFVSKPCYNTQLEVYAACHSYPKWQSKIILNDELHDSFKTSIEKYGEKTTPRIIIGTCMIIPTTILASIISQPLDIFSSVWFGGCLMVQYEIIATSCKFENDIGNRQKFLYEFLNNRIEKTGSVLSNLTKAQSGFIGGSQTTNLPHGGGDINF
jgi:hypothetical protein